MTTPMPATDAGVDRVLVDIADYVLDYRIEAQETIESARLCLTDALACGLDALDTPECTRLLGPVVPGTIVPHGARVPGTSYELDPANAAFSLGCMIRWLDSNDAFTVVTGCHPSDNLASVLMLADCLSRQRLANGREPIRMRSVLDYLTKAYEIMGCLAIENDFFGAGTDHNVLIRVATTAVLTHMLGGTREEIVNAVSNAWIDASLVAYRYSPNTGSRKNWASADANSQAVRLAMLAVRGEMGYPSVLTAKHFGFYDARFAGKPFRFQRPYGEYVIRHSMFKFLPVAMHGQTAVECAFRLHPMVKDRLAHIERIEVSSSGSTIPLMHRTGPLRNVADRDHCIEYIVAVGLMHGMLGAQELQDDFAGDPRIDDLRNRTTIVEDPVYTKDFHDPAKRSNANAVQVWFKDGSSTPKVEVEYPLGHLRRRAEAIPALQAKFEASLGRRFPQNRCEQILALCDDRPALDRTPVNEFVDLFATKSGSE